MRARWLVRAWNDFFFAPQPPTPVALYRILYGLMVIADLILLRADWLAWYGTNAFTRMDTMRQVAGGVRLNLFLIMPQGDAWIQGFYWVFLLFAVFLTVGFLSRLSSMAVFLCLVSIHQRNFFILNSGDTILRVTGFFLMFAPTGAAISVDRLVSIWRGKESLDIRPLSPWAQRMIQIQAALAYFSTFLWKMRGTEWINGTALYYTSRLVEFQRFPFPTLENGIILKLATWFALFTEFALGVLVWFRRFRYWILLMGVCLHLSIEYAMNVPLFQWIAMATYVTFIDPAELSRAWGWLRRRVAGRLGNTVDVIYDGNCIRTARLANVLRAVDVLGRLNVADVHAFDGHRSQAALPIARGCAWLVIDKQGSFFKGFAGLLEISQRVPLLWLLAPLSLASGRRRKESLRAAKAAK
ncbi:MAG: hypothetical protein JWO48_357 [Bryobacterales bacterium]|nr:hypothetical protein [Bryobacterales bacterium]